MSLNSLRRRNRALRIKLGTRPEVFVDPRERVEADLTTVTLHPTKGFRRICGKRAALYAIPGLAACTTGAT